MTYLELLEVELGHTELIRNPCLWGGIWRFLIHQIIPWGWAYKNILELGHTDLQEAYQLESSNRSY